LSPVRAVFIKELLDSLRDKKAVMSAMLFPIFGPAVIYFMMTAMISIRSEVQETAVPIQNMDNAPHLIRWLTERGVTFERFDGDARDAVEAKDKDFVLIIPDAYQKRFAESRTAYVEVVHDSSRADAQAATQRIASLIRGYNGEIAALRLITRGVSPDVMRAVEAREIEIASKQQIAARALTFIPMYIVLAAFVSGMGVAVDSTAGERERSTLEALLINPVDRSVFVTGKWLAAAGFASVGVILTMLLCVIVLQHIPLEELGLKFQVTPMQVIAMVLATFPLAFLATSMQLLLGSFAKSFKDAQSYIGFLVFLPMAPAIFTVFNPIATQTWMFAIPCLGQHLLLTDVMGGKPVPAVGYVLSAISTMIVAAGLVQVTARFFKRESIIFS